MNRWLTWAACIVVALGSRAAVGVEKAEDDVLSLIPAESQTVARVSSLEEFRARAMVFAKRAMPALVEQEAPEAEEKWRAMLASDLARGIDVEQPIYTFSLPIKADGGPRPPALLPIATPAALGGGWIPDTTQPKVVPIAPPAAPQPDDERPVLGPEVKGGAPAPPVGTAPSIPIASPPADPSAQSISSYPTTESPNPPVEAKPAARLSAYESPAVAAPAVLTAEQAPEDPAHAKLQQQLEQMRALGVELPAGALRFGPAEPEPNVLVVKVRDEAAFRRGLIGVARNEDVVVEPRKDGFTKISPARGVKPGKTPIDADLSPSIDAAHQTWYFARRGEWVLYTAQEKCLAHLTNLPPEKSLAAAIDDQARSTLQSGHFSVLVNLGQSLKELVNEIKIEREMVLAGMDTQWGKSFGGLGADPERLADLIMQWIEKGTTAVAELRWLAASVELDAEAASGTIVLTSQRGGLVAEALGGLEKSELPAMARLPRGGVMYFGGNSYGSIDRWVTSLAETWTPDHPETRARKRAVADLERAGVKDFGVCAFSRDEIRPDTGMRFVHLIPARDSEALKRFSRFSHETRRDGTGDHTVRKTYYEVAFERLGTHNVDLVTEIPEHKDVEDAGDRFFQLLDQQLYGREKRESRVIAAPGMLLKSDDNRDTLANTLAMIEAGRDTAGRDPAFLATRAKLDRNANMVLLVDLPLLAQAAAYMAGAFLETPEEIAKIAAKFAPKRLAYSGLSLTTTPGAVRVRWYVPAEQVSWCAALADLQLSQARGPWQIDHSSAK